MYNSEGESLKRTISSLGAKYSTFISATFPNTIYAHNHWKQLHRDLYLSKSIKHFNPRPRRWDSLTGRNQDWGKKPGLTSWVSKSEEVPRKRYTFSIVERNNCWARDARMAFGSVSRVSCCWRLSVLNLSRVCAIICSCRYLGKWFRFPKSVTACTESRYPPTKWVQFSINLHLLLPSQMLYQHKFGICVDHKLYKMKTYIKRNLEYTILFQKGFACKNVHKFILT